MAEAEVLADLVGQRAGNIADDVVAKVVGKDVASSEINTDFKDKKKEDSDSDDDHYHKISDPRLEYLPAEDVINAEYTISMLMPLRNMPLKKTFPILCCCLSGDVDQKEVEEYKKNKLEQILNRERRLSSIVKLLNGKYKGSDYIEDSKKNDQDGDLHEDEKNPRNEMKGEPLDNYGFGISAWFGLLRFLFCLFCILSLLAIGLAVFYKSKGHLTGGRVEYQNLIARFSLGNIGSAQTICLTQFLKLQHSRTLECEKGTIAKLKYFGVHTGGTTTLTEAAGRFAEHPIGNSYCGDRDHLPAGENCIDILKKKDFMNAFEKTCVGKKSCEFNMVKEEFFQPKDSIPSHCKVPTTQVYIQAACSFSLEETQEAQYTGVAAIIICSVLSAIYFESVRYEEGRSALAFKRWDLQTCTASDYTVRLNLPREWYNQFRKKQEIRALDGKEKQDIVAFLKKKIENKVNSLPAAFGPVKTEEETGEEEQPKEPVEIAAIKLAYFNGVIINLLRDRGQTLIHEPGEVDEANATIKKASDDNAEIFQRPVCAFVTFTTQEAKTRIEKYLYELNEDGTTNDNYDQTKLFHMFKDENGEKLPLEFVEAPEPSDIIWENIEWSDSYRIKATCVVFLVSTVLLLVVLLMFIGIKAKAGQVQIMYPPRMDCTSITSLFTVTSDSQTILDQKKYLEYASEDKNMTHQYIGGGYYQCYCKKFSNYMLLKERATQLANKYMQKNSTTSTGDNTNSVSKVLEEHSQLKQQTYDLCYDFQFDKYWALFLTSTVSALITILNIVIRNFIIVAIGYIHYDTRSQVTNQIMWFVFLASFVNTGFMGLLANADLYYTQVISWIFPFLRGQYSDINRDWYLTIGPQMVQTMIILAVFPWIELFMFGGLWKLKQWKDSGLPCCPKKRKVETFDELPEGAILVGAENNETIPEGDDDPFAGIDNTDGAAVNEEDDDPFAGIDNTGPCEGEENLAEEKKDAAIAQLEANMTARYTETKSIQQYISVYGGTNYLMHFKYSSILVQIFVAFMYGMFIPMLFPVATFGIANMYICEKLALTYLHKRPPMYDDSLNSRALAILKFAPIFMFMLGFWAIGNTAIFSNMSAPRVFFNRSADPQHPAIKLHEYDQTHLAFAVFVLWVIRAFFIETIYELCIKKCKDAIFGEPDDGLEIGDLTIDEKLPNFFDALSGEFQKTWYTTELYNIRHLGIRNLDNNQFRMLKTLKGAKGGKKICNMPVYDLLYSYEYQNDFFFETLVNRQYSIQTGEPEIDRAGAYFHAPMNMWQSNNAVTQYMNKDENRIRPNSYDLKELDVFDFMPNHNDE